MEKEKLIEIDKQGNLGWSTSGKPFRKLRPEDDGGFPIGNLWDNISMINPQSKERLGYPTQKPLQLLERIIEISSNKDDLVLDAFCGCGTTLIAAQKLQRKWIGIDISPTSCRVMAQRLWDIFKLDEGKDFMLSDLPIQKKNCAARHSQLDWESALKFLETCK